MSETMQKGSWYRNWRAARDRVRASAVACACAAASEWARIADRIERAFESRFGQAFGVFLAERAG